MATGLVILLGAGPVLNLSGDPVGMGLAAAGLRDGARSSGGAGGAGAGQKRSKVDRQPRASSAKQGSIQRPNTRQIKDSRQAKTPARTATGAAGTAKRPAAVTSRDKKPAAREPSQVKRPAPKTRQAGQTQSRAEWNQKLQTHEGRKPGAVSDRKVASRDVTEKRADRRNRNEPDRQERQKNVEDRRKDYADNRKDIRDERRESMEDLQKNRQDFLKAQQEDRQDFMDDVVDERRDLWEDVYDHHHYWGDWDDDDDDDAWLWGIVGGVAGYMIGAAVNSPPAGTVAVPYGGTDYQYYGGAFYEPAPSGDGYVTAPAPVGAQVEAPQLDCTIVFGPDPADPGYCFFQGAFFSYDEDTDSYLVTDPPTGTEVPYLPAGYTQEKINGVEYYKLGTTYYRTYLAGDDVLFVVSEI
jgi:hypothetical protein